MKILIILTCYNRKKVTRTCIQTIISGNPGFDLSFLIVDDNSTDGTKQLLNNLKDKYDIRVLHGNGNLFYSGGMHKGMQYVIDNYKEQYDYLLIINDDVVFFERFLIKLILQSNEKKNAIIVGAMCNNKGRLSYGALKITNGIHFKRLNITEFNTKADTFEANCVLIPYCIFTKSDIIDNYYIHSLGDIDYGLQLTKNGNSIYSSMEYVGVCNENSNANTWLDKSLNIRERIRRKESPKGAPVRQWLYFLKKNWGIKKAIRYGFTPYIRILLRK